jgi:hypothetical protein
MRFAGYSEKVSLPGSPRFVQFLTQSLQSAQRTEGVTALPSLLIHRKDLPSQQETESLLRMNFWVSPQRNESASFDRSICIVWSVERSCWRSIESISSVKESNLPCSLNFSRERG